MRRLAAVALALAGCGGSKEQKSSRSRPPAAARDAAAAGAPDAAGRATPVDAAAARAPTGTLAGQPFAPDAVLLLESSDGGKLGFYQMPSGTSRRTCEEPMGSESARETSLYRPIAAWTVGAPVTSAIDDWGATDVGFGEHHPGTVTVTLTRKDPATFRLAGTIDMKADDGSWALSGPFEGDYCPTKGVHRDAAAPIANQPWTLDLVPPASLPAEPVAATIAGRPTTIALVQLRERARLGVQVQELTFLAAAPPEPCAPRPRGGWLKSSAAGGAVRYDGPTFEADSFAIDLAQLPAAGGAATGHAPTSGPDKIDQIVNADLEVFEPDGFRSWQYAQYWSATVAIDTLDEASAKGRVYLAIPDDGKDLLVGAFTAVRCPPLAD